MPVQGCTGIHLWIHLAEGEGGGMSHATQGGPLENPTPCVGEVVEVGIAVVCTVVSCMLGIVSAKGASIGTMD